MRNYADLVSENNRLKLLERNSRSKEIKVKIVIILSKINIYFFLSFFKISI